MSSVNTPLMYAVMHLCGFKVKMSQPSTLFTHYVLFTLAFASTSPLKFNNASTAMQILMQRTGLDPICVFLFASPLMQCKGQFVFAFASNCNIASTRMSRSRIEIRYRTHFFAFESNSIF